MELATQTLGKRYGSGQWGLRNFSLTLRPGILGLLGPNGAGKSTLLRILATITKPTAGTVTWNGVNIVRHPDAIRSDLGYLPQDFGIYPHLSAVEFLEYLAAVKGLDRASARRRIDALLVSLNLAAAGRRPLGTYSGGMKQRIGVAQALLNDPQILIIDEPTVGLDPEERVAFRNLLNDLAGERIVILSTHIVSDVEATAASIAILDHGELVQHSARETLLAAVEGKVWEWLVPSTDLVSVRRRYLITSAIRRADGLLVRAVSAEAPSSSARAVSPALEDAYLDCISRQKATAAA
jgi:ABC-2 type transport system ATP-binding protein